MIDSVSYCVGVSFGNMLKSSNLEAIDIAQMEKGIFDVLAGDSIRIPEQQIGVIIQTYMQKAEKAMAKVREERQAKFMAENKEKEGVQVLESGLQYKIENAGNEEIKATVADTVEVHYVGTLLDGTKFDSSYDRGETAKFPLNRVIKGWTEGMQLVGEGGKITLWVPYELGYGPRAMGPNLPAYSTLIFEVELVKVYKAAEETEKK
ncbi:MAG: FKBP-type peptidyl-prolyl cis-trans isomerase [Bacteroidales bacterium]|nr:FKBP-type peptidyl-prolyl cis-trans isomerase [Bacteroidales bacterium]